MTTIHSIPFRARNPIPSSLDPAFRRLIRLPTFDQAHRRAPPVTLPGPQSGLTPSEAPMNWGSNASPAPPSPYRAPGKHDKVHVAPRAYAGEHAKATNNDGKGPYTAVTSSGA